MFLQPIKLAFKNCKHAYNSCKNLKTCNKNNNLSTNFGYNVSYNVKKKAYII